MQGGHFTYTSQHREGKSLHNKIQAIHPQVNNRRNPLALAHADLGWD